jgi:hypothetical protein
MQQVCQHIGLQAQALHKVGQTQDHTKLGTKLESVRTAIEIDSTAQI